MTSMPPAGRSPFKSSLLAAVLLPIVAMSAWLVVSRQFLHVYVWRDWVAMTASLIIGAPFAFRASTSTTRRVVVLALYVVVGALGLLIYTFVFSAAVYGTGL